MKCCRCGADAAPTNGISITTSDGGKYCQKCTKVWLKEASELGDETARDLLEIMEAVYD